MVRVNDRGEVIVSVAVPVQRFRAVRGALLLSTQGADIDDMVEAERLADRQGVPGRRRRHGGAVDPARRHHRRPGAAARRRRRARAPPHPHPRRNSRFHRAAATRSAHLSGALRDMTNALYTPHRGDRELRRRRRARTEESADLAALGGRDAAARQDRRQPQAAARRHPARREAARPADLRHFRRQPPRRRIAAAGSGAGRSRQAARRAGRASPTRCAADDVKVTLDLRGRRPAAFMVPGHDSRLGQVINNLIDNARSFSPPGGTVRVTCRRLQERGRDHRRRRRARHPPGRVREDLRALLHRPARTGLRPEFRPRPVDLQADRRGAWRPHLGREPHGAAAPRAKRAAGARRALRRAPAGDRDGRPDVPTDPRLRRAGRRQGGADPRARPAPASRGWRWRCSQARGARRTAVRAAGRPTTASMSKPRTAGCWCGQPPALAGLIEVRGLGIRRVALRAARRGRPGGRPGRRRRRAAARPQAAETDDRRDHAAAARGRSRHRPPCPSLLASCRTAGRIDPGPIWATSAPRGPVRKINHNAA